MAWRGIVGVSELEIRAYLVVRRKILYYNIKKFRFRQMRLLIQNLKFITLLKYEILL